MDGHGSHVPIQFHWTCKYYNIQLLFLPVHPSHVLQPLDLGVFAPLKSRYRHQISNLASLDDAALVKKQHFIECYYLARLDTFNERVLRSGWKAAGICPYNPQKGLNSSQIQKQQLCPVTPPLPHQIPLIETPKSWKHLCQQSQSISKRTIQQSARGGSRQDFAHLLQEAINSIDYLNTQHVVLQAQNDGCKASLQSYTEKRRKRVQVDPNTLFANIETVIQAQRAQALIEASLAGTQPIIDAKNASEAIMMYEQAELQSTWQLDGW
jgi:hypothetical protein